MQRGSANEENAGLSHIILRARCGQQSESGLVLAPQFRYGMPRPKRATKDKLMDAAEKLFARRGFHGVSLREITAEAGVKLALVNYHFGTKKNLLAQVIERRGHVLNDERLRRLAEARLKAAPQAPSTEAVVGAFLNPILDRLAHAGPGWHSYFSLLAYVNNSPEWGRTMMGTTFNGVVREFIQAVMDSLPGSAPEDIYWATTS